MNNRTIIAIFIIITSIYSHYANASQYLFSPDVDFTTIDFTKLEQHSKNVYLWVAVKRKDTATAKIALDNGAQFSWASWGGLGEYPINAAARQLDHKMVKLLLEHGAPVNQTNGAYRPLASAIIGIGKNKDSSKHADAIETVTTLLAAGANTSEGVETLDRAALFPKNYTYQELLNSYWTGSGAEIKFRSIISNMLNQPTHASMIANIGIEALKERGNELNQSTCTPIASSSNAAP